MGYQEKHGIPSILVILLAKFGFQEKHGIPEKTWNTSKKMIIDKKWRSDLHRSPTACMAA
jgi:hypothetical protein